MLASERRADHGVWNFPCRLTVQLMPFLKLALDACDSSSEACHAEGSRRLDKDGDVAAFFENEPENLVQSNLSKFTGRG